MLIFIIFAAGCSPHAVYTVEVLSEPTGARIELNDDYIGDAPITLNIQGTKNRYFYKDTVIRAIPKESGYTQTKWFDTSDNFNEAKGDKIPQRIFFDTNLSPIPNKLDVNIEEFLKI